MFVENNGTYININHIAKFQKFINDEGTPIIRIWHSTKLGSYKGETYSNSEVRFKTEEELDQFIAKILAMAT